METNLHFEVIQYSKYGYGKLDEFTTLDEAVDWVDKKQSIEDRRGNPDEICYEVVPVSQVIYCTLSQVKILDAVA